MNHVLIAIDSGRYLTKGILYYGGEQQYIAFRTKVQTVDNLGVELAPETYHVTYEETEFLVGHMASEESQDANISKQTLTHKIAVYTAISLLMAKAGLNANQHSIQLIVNAPVNMYKNQETKTSFQAFMSNNNHPIIIDVNEVSYRLQFEQVIVAFEGIGSIFERPNDYSNQTNIVIDIGGLNTTYCLFDGINPDFNSMIVNQMGINQLKSRVEQELIRQYNINVSSYDLETIIKNGYLSSFGEVKNGSDTLIRRLKQEHLDAIINYAIRQGYTFNNAHVMFVGGGSLLLARNIKENYPNAETIVNPQFSNLKSYMQILKVKMGYDEQVS